MQRYQLSPALTAHANIEAPFDSGDFPKTILVMGDDIAESYCDACGSRADEWIVDDFTDALGAFAGAMYDACLYCAACVPLSYDEITGYRLFTLTGEECPSDYAAGQARAETPYAMAQYAAIEAARFAATERALEMR